MGKGGKEPPITVNTRKLGKSRGFECFEELSNFMACMTKSNFDIDDKCAGERRALSACAAAAAKKGKAVDTVNFHLQRLSRLMK